MYKEKNYIYTKRQQIPPSLKVIKNPKIFIYEISSLVAIHRSKWHSTNCFPFKHQLRLLAQIIHQQFMEY